MALYFNFIRIFVNQSFQLTLESFYDKKKSRLITNIINIIATILIVWSVCFTTNTTYSTSVKACKHSWSCNEKYPSYEDNDYAVFIDTSNNIVFSTKHGNRWRAIPESSHNSIYREVMPNVNIYNVTKEPELYYYRYKLEGNDDFILLRVKDVENIVKYLEDNSYIFMGQNLKDEKMYYGKIISSEESNEVDDLEDIILN